MGPSAFLLALAAGGLQAWDKHADATRHALEGTAELSASIRAETLEEYLQATGLAPTPRDFFKTLEIHPDTDLPFRDGESSGSETTLLRVLSAYADEPDWGMDQELFKVYPHLWKDEYRYMGVQEGSFTTRAFRHMYFAAGYYKEPASPGGPPQWEPTPIGETPSRAQLLFDKALEAFRKGRPYWGARFLSWSVHYVQDVTMPFHTDQLPSMALIRFGPDAKPDLLATARNVAYYHVALEAHASRSLGGRSADGGLQGKLSKALKEGPALPGSTTAGELVRQAALEARGAAPRAAKAALAFFPRLDDPRKVDPLKLMEDPAFWEDVRAREKPGEPGPYGELAGFLESQHVLLGRATRALVGLARAEMGRFQPALGRNPAPGSAPPAPGSAALPPQVPGPPGPAQVPRAPRAAWTAGWPPRRPSK